MTTACTPVAMSTCIALSVSWRLRSERPLDLLNAADEALYRAKAAGRIGSSVLAWKMTPAGRELS